MIFHDRIEAGKSLAKLCQHYCGAPNTLILGLPRGGVPIAYTLHKELNLPMDILLVRKLGVPWHKELAMGAISLGDVIVFNKDIVEMENITEEAIQAVIEKEKAELNRRNQQYRGEKPLPDIKNKTIILTDDGIATGATLRAGIAALRELEPAKIVVAVPIAPASVYHDIGDEADEIIICETPTPFYGIGMWYHQFPQLDDQDVIDLIKKSQTSPS